MKTCSQCGVSKELAEFQQRSRSDARPKSACKECTRRIARNRYHKTKSPDDQRASNLKRDFGITIEDYDRIYNEQEGCCVICETHSSAFTKRLAVDHCHTTGELRGLLCMYCNTGLGKFKDSRSLLDKAIKYLDKRKLHG